MTKKEKKKPQTQFNEYHYHELPLVSYEYQRDSPKADCSESFRLTAQAENSEQAIRIFKKLKKEVNSWHEKKNQQVGTQKRKSD